MADAMLKTLRETRQWLTELRRWGGLLRPALGRAFEQGRRQARSRRPTLAPPAQQAVAALRGLGFKTRTAELAVREAAAECGDADVEVLIRAALRRLR